MLAGSEKAYHCLLNSVTRIHDIGQYSIMLHYLGQLRREIILVAIG